MNEKHPTRSAENAAQPLSLRDYWNNPTGLLPDTPSAPKRRTAPHVTTPSLWEHIPTLPLQTARPIPPGGESVQTVSALTPTTQTAPFSEGMPVPSRANETPKLRERLQRRGVATLSSAELLSLVLRTGQAGERIVPRVSALLDSYSVQQLLQADFGELCEQYGLGKTKAAQLQAVLEVARRLTLPTDEEKYTIRSPSDAEALLRPDMEFLDHEELRVLLLNMKNQVQANLLLYQGSINSSVLRAAEIFRPAVTRKYPNILVCHNHPSGDPTPSPEDITTTEQLVEAGKLLDIDVLDHLIIGRNPRFVSLKERLRW